MIRLYQKKKITLNSSFLVCLCFCLLIACGNSSSPGKEIMIENGELDLSNWDFKQDGPVKLSGTWKFCWLASAPEYKTENFDASHWQDFQVPMYWNRITGTANGYGWFRLKIKNIKESNLGIYLYSVCTAYELYANGRLIMNRGYPGHTRQETIPVRMPQEVLLPHEGSLSLAWKISNFHDRSGGASNSPIIGRPEDLKAIAWKKQTNDAFVLGIIAIIGIYHLLLWFFRKEDKASLYFAMICLVIIIRIIVSYYYLRGIFPFLMQHEWRTKPDLLSIPLIWFFMRSFLFQLFPCEFNKIIYRFFLISAILFSLIVIFSPSWVYMHLLIPYWLIIILAGIWLLSVLIRSVKHGRQGAVIILAALAVFFLVVINDIIYSNFPFLTKPLIQVGLVIFIIAQSAVLSLRFTAAYRTAEHLSCNLQKEVKIKTTTITRQNRALQRLNREKTLFFINLAHELKTPLTLINNYLHKYIKAKGSNEDAGIILVNFQKLKNDIINFLDHEKLLRGQIIYNHTAVIDLPQFLQKKVILFKEAALLKSITITSNIQQELFIKMDPAALDRVVNNLLDNAVKYTEKKGEVHIDCVNGEAEIKLAFRDNGIGIAPEHQPYIFRPYYQASHKKFNTQGMGMGLNIVKKIMEEVGGEINLSSQLHQGTVIMLRFKKYLPGVAETITRDFPGFTPVWSGKASQFLDVKYDKDKKNILLVEDNAEMLVYLQHSLINLYNVFYTQNGQDALSRLNTIPLPDLILSDIMMDVMNGYDFHARLAQIEKYRSIPLIFLSARSSQEDRMAGLTSGAVDYISKPFDLPELLARIKALLRIREAQHTRSKVEIEQRVLQAIHSQPQSDNGFGEFEKKCDQFQLTLREREILQLIFQAWENKEIAGQLNISYPTVRTHIQHIFEKCGITNKVELLRIFKNF